MSRQAEPFLLARLNGINEQDFQQRELQLEEHVQNTTPHQHPDNVRMKKNWRDLCEMKELLEERRDRKAKPNNKLFIGKIHYVARKVNRG